MSKVLEIREICGDYALEIEYSKDYSFTMFFNSRRNAETVKRCVELDDSVPNVATAVDFVEVVRCRDCKHYESHGNGKYGLCKHYKGKGLRNDTDYCSYGKRREE